jgi:hypothetical protein
MLKINWDTVLAICGSIMLSEIKDRHLVPEFGYGSSRIIEAWNRQAWNTKECPARELDD